MLVFSMVSSRTFLMRTNSSSLFSRVKEIFAPLSLRGSSLPLLFVELAFSLPYLSTEKSGAAPASLPVQKSLSTRDEASFFDARSLEGKVNSYE